MTLNVPHQDSAGLSPIDLVLSDKHGKRAIFVEPKAQRLLEVGAMLVTCQPPAFLCSPQREGLSMTALLFLFPTVSVVFSTTLLSPCRGFGPLVKHGCTSGPVDQLVVQFKVMCIISPFNIFF